MSNVNFFKGRGSFENAFAAGPLGNLSRFLKDIKGDSFCVLNEIGNNSYSIARWKTQKKPRREKERKEREGENERESRGILSFLRLLKTYSKMIASTTTPAAAAAAVA